MKSNSVRRHFVSLSLVLALVIFGGCTTVPITGRQQVMLVSMEQETQLGLTSFDQTKKEVPVNKDPTLNQMLQRVGKQIAAVATSDMPGAQWEFVLFESREVNAFCLPGGKVGVYTGILPITKDEAGLATVIGHEVAHAVARHGAERLSEAMLLQTGGELLGSSLSSANPQTVATVQIIYGLGAQLGRALPHSRQQELEADRIGLIYLARAGYNPDAALDFWRRFADYGRQHGGGSTPWFLSTHPVDETRIQQIQQLLPQAREEYAKSKAVGTVGK